MCNVRVVFLRRRIRGYLSIMKVHKLTMSDLLTGAELPEPITIKPTQLMRDIITKCNKHATRHIWNENGEYFTRRRVAGTVQVGLIAPKSVEKLMYPEQWVDQMKKSGSCLISFGDDTGCGAGLLLGLTTNVFMAEGINSGIQRRGDEYAQIVSYDGNLALYLPRLSNAQDWRSKLARIVYTHRLPVIIPSKINFIGVDVEQVDHSKLGVFAELSSVSNGTITPALSSEYSHFKSVVIDELPYVYPSIPNTTAWCYVTPFTKLIKVKPEILASEVDVSRAVTIGGYAKTGFTRSTK